MQNEILGGKVIIAGAGPGDPDLITIKLMERLAIAEVIIVDRLVNPEIIDRYASKDALVLMTGKQGYHDGSVAQRDKLNACFPCKIQAYHYCLPSFSIEKMYNSCRGYR